MTTKVIAVCILLFLERILAIVNPIHLILFSEGPISQLLSSDGRFMHVFAGEKSFSYNNSTEDFKPNLFSGKEYLSTNQGVIYERIDEQTIAIACGKYSLTIISEQGKLLKNKDEDDYNPEGMCSFIKINQTEYFLAYTTDEGTNMEIYHYGHNEERTSFLSITAIIPSIFYVSCSLLKEKKMVVCYYYNDLNFLFGDFYHTSNFTKENKLSTNKSAFLIKSIVIEPSTIFIFSLSTRLYCFIFTTVFSEGDALFPESTKVIAQSQSSIDFFDIKPIRTKQDGKEYEWLIITCNLKDCYLSKYNAKCSQASAEIQISLPLQDCNKAVSVQLFSSNYISILISRDFSNYALTYAFPDCSYLSRIEFGTNTFSFSSILNELTLNLNISFNLNDNKMDSVLFTVGYLYVKSDTFYPFNQIAIYFKKKGTYSYNYALIDEEKQLSSNCKVDFYICYFKCDNCLSYGKESNMQCLTCSHGYYLSFARKNQCVSKDECITQSGYVTETECVKSCYNLNLLTDVEGSSCVSQCKPNQFLDKMSSQCLTKQAFEDKIMYYIGNIDTNIVYLYENFPFKETNNYTMSIYNTSILPENPSLEIISINSFERAQLSSVDLKSCKDLLIKENQLDNTKPLLIVKYDYIENSQKTNAVKFSVYSIEGKKLNVSLCSENNEEILIATPLLTAFDENITLARNYSLKGVNVFDSSVPFFNDFCYPTTSEHHTDIPMINRLEYIYLDDSTLCNPGCKYVSLNYNKNFVVCSCAMETLSEYNQNYAQLKEQLSSSWIYYNFAVVECITLVFDHQKFTNNLGSWLLIIMLIVEAICALYFLVYGFKALKLALITLTPEKKIEIKCHTDMIFKRKEIHSDLLQINMINKPNNEIHLESDVKPSRFIDNNCNKIEFKIPEPALKRNSANTNNINRKGHLIHFPIVQNKTKGKTIKHQQHNNQLVSNDNNDLIPKLEEKNDSEIEINQNQMSQQNQTQKGQLESISFVLFQLENNPLFTLSLNKSNFGSLYWLFLKNEQPIYRAFFVSNPYKTKILHISLFFLCISLSFTLNAFFCTVDNVSKSFTSKGNINFVYNLPKILYSFLSCYFIKILFNGLASISFVYSSFSNKRKSNSEYNKRTMMNHLKMRLYLFFILKLIFLIVFWYYVSAFCAVYPNIQMTWIICSATSFIIQMLFPFCLACFLSLGLLMTIKYKVIKLVPFFLNFAEN